MFNGHKFWHYPFWTHSYLTQICRMILGLTRKAQHWLYWLQSIKINQLHFDHFGVCNIDPNPDLKRMISIFTWWLIPLSKWVITPVINGISRVNPLITGVITHLLSGMSHQVV